MSKPTIPDELEDLLADVEKHAVWYSKNKHNKNPIGHDIGMPKYVALERIAELISKREIEARKQERSKIFDLNCDEVHDAIRSAVKDWGTIKLVIGGKESVFDLTGVISTAVQDKLDKLKSAQLTELQEGKNKE